MVPNIVIKGTKVMYMIYGVTALVDISGGAVCRNSTTHFVVPEILGMSHTHGHE